MVAATADTRLFHCGVLADCPIHVVHIAGLEFPRTTVRIEGYGDEQVNSELQGVVHAIDEARFKLIRKRVKTKVVRSTKGKRAKSFLLSTENKGYKPMDGDVPLEELIYFKEVDHDPQHGRKHKSLADSKAELDQGMADLEASRAGIEKGRAEIGVLAEQLHEERLQFEIEREEWEADKAKAAADAETKPAPDAKAPEKKDKKGTKK